MIHSAITQTRTLGFSNSRTPLKKSAGKRVPLENTTEKNTRKTLLINTTRELQSRQKRKMIALEYTKNLATQPRLKFIDNLV